MKLDADYNLSRRLDAIHGYRKWIIGGTVLCSLVVLLISLLLPKIYRSTTYLLVSEPRMDANSQNPVWQYSLIRTYVPFVDSDALIAQAIRDLHLDGAPYELTVDSFRRHRYLDVDVPKGTRLLEIDVEFPNSQMSANLANYFAQNASDFNRDLTSAVIKSTQAFLVQRLDQASKHLTEAETKLLEVKKTSAMEDKDKEISILLGEKAEISAELEKLRMDIVQKEAQVKTLREELSKEPRVFTLRKSVVSDNFVEHAVQGLRGATDGTLVVAEDSVNTIYEELRKQYAESLALARAHEAGALAAKTELAAVNSEIVRLLAKNTAMKSEIERAEREHKLATDYFEKAAQNYNNASMAVASQSEDLKQLAAARAPGRPVRPNVLLNVVLAGLLSCVLLSLTAVTWSGFRAMQSKAAGGAESIESPLTQQN